MLDTASKDAISAFSDSRYDNTVKCLINMYHRPREIIAQHSYTLIEFPPVKEGDIKEERHTLYACDSFHSKYQEDKKSTLNVCFNCLRTMTFGIQMRTGARSASICTAEVTLPTSECTDFGACHCLLLALNMVLCFRSCPGDSMDMV